MCQWRWIMLLLYRKSCFNPRACLQMYDAMTIVQNIDHFLSISPQRHGFLFWHITSVFLSVISQHDWRIYEHTYSQLCLLYFIHSYTLRVVGNGIKAQSANPEVKVKGADPVINQIIDKLKHINQVILSLSVLHLLYRQIVPSFFIASVCQTYCYLLQQSANSTMIDS